MVCPVAVRPIVPRDTTSKSSPSVLFRGIGVVQHPSNNLTFSQGPFSRRSFAYQHLSFEGTFKDLDNICREKASRRYSHFEKVG